MSPKKRLWPTPMGQRRPREADSQANRCSGDGRRQNPQVLSTTTTQEQPDFPITLITGGFPCQPFSVAGKQRGKEDDRYLWPEMLRVIEEVRPRWVVAENVAGLIRMGLDDCISDLENIGYTVEPYLIPACAVNAPHRRDRIFIVAYANESKQGTRLRADASEERDLRGHNQGDVLKRCSELSRQGQDVADSISERLEERESITRDTGEECQAIERSGYSNGESWWSVEPELGRVANGIPHRVDRLRALGNAVVPQQIYPILKAIADMEL